MLKKKILVTGSAGFIGFSVALELLKKGFNVVGIDNFNDYYSPIIKEARNKILTGYPNFKCYKTELEDELSLKQIFSDETFDLVCHLAAQAGVRRSITEPMIYQKYNIQAFLNILECVRHSKINRLVYASSSSVYGGNTKMPFSESDRVDNPVSLYAATKKANELMAHSYSHLYNIQTIGLRFFTVYGPWGRPDMAMWLFADAMLKNKPIKVFNNGKMKRDCTYIDDIVAGIISALLTEKLDKYEIFNLGNHHSELLLDIIRIIEKDLGITAEKIMLPLQPGDVPESYADIEKAKSKLGFEPKTSMQIGIPKFLKWYKENQSLVDNCI